jgi:hypothetical protein
VNVGEAVHTCLSSGNSTREGVSGEGECTWLYSVCESSELNEIMGSAARHNQPGNNVMARADGRRWAIMSVVGGKGGFFPVIDKVSSVVGVQPGLPEVGPVGDRAGSWLATTTNKIQYIPFLQAKVCPVFHHTYHECDLHMAHVQ